MAIERTFHLSNTNESFLQEPDENILNGAIFMDGKWIKTGSYYIRSRPKVQAQQFVRSENIVVVNHALHVIRESCLHNNFGIMPLPTSESCSACNFVNQSA